MAIQWTPLSTGGAASSMNAAMIPKLQNNWGMLFNGLADAAKVAQQYGHATQDVNTKAAIAQAVGASSLEQLAEQRSGMADMRGIDPERLGKAINEQDALLRARTLSDYQIQDASDKQGTKEWMSNNLSALQKAMTTGEFTGETMPPDASSLLGYMQGGVNFKQQGDQFDKTHKQRGDQFDRTLTQQDSHFKTAQDNDMYKFGKNYKLAENADSRAGESHDIAVQQAYKADPGSSTTVFHNGQEYSVETPGLQQMVEGARMQKPLTGSGVGAKNAVDMFNIIGKNGVGDVLRTLKLDNDPVTLAMMAIESGGTWTTSHSGAVGPMQIMPKYAAGFAKEHRIVGDPTKDVKANIATGSAVLHKYVKEFDGNLEAAAIAYNGGHYMGKTAYNSWKVAGGKGNVADFIPGAYPEKGKMVNYSSSARTEARGHAGKMVEAYGEIQERMRRAGGQTAPQTPQQAAPAQATTANNQTGSGLQSYMDGSDPLSKNIAAQGTGNQMLGATAGLAALGGLQRATTPPPKQNSSLGYGNFSVDNSLARTARTGLDVQLERIAVNERPVQGSLADVKSTNEYEKFKKDQNIVEDRGTLLPNMALNKGQYVFNVIKDTPEFKNGSAATRKRMLEVGIENAGHSLWKAGGEKIKLEIAKAAQDSAADKETASLTKQREALYESAQKLVDSSKKSGKQPMTLEQAAQFLHPELYRAVNGDGTKASENPFL